MAGIKGKSGRQPELTEGILTAIITGIRSGLPDGRAAQAAGFSPAAITKWKHRGEADLLANKSTIFAKFVNALIRADVEFEQVRLAMVIKASQNHRTWQASAWLLERKFSHWRKPLQLSSDPKNPIIPAGGGAILILPDNHRGDGPKPEKKTRASAR